MGVERGALSLLDFEFFSKKGYFLSFEREKTNFATFGPPRKILKKSPNAPPLEKTLPTPMIASMIYFTDLALVKEVWRTKY